MPHYLQQLENEAIYIFRESVSEFERIVMLYSIGKDSSVLLRIAQKAFYPMKIPFPLMHIDTGYKFPEMYQFRDNLISQYQLDFIIEKNQAAIDEGTHPSKQGNDKCCGLLKTTALLKSLHKHNFNASFAGARRDEEKSRAKERIYSFRDKFGQWNPKKQRPEVWNLLNSNIDTNESVRIFPLSNWTELDIWNYIKFEKINILPLYFAQKQKIINRNGLIMPIKYLTAHSTQDKIKFTEDDIKIASCRYRSLGCSPCTGAIISKANTIELIIKELEETHFSERENRIIDLTSESAMEKKKKEGYF